jgi:hypothetical protein
MAEKREYVAQIKYTSESPLIGRRFHKPLRSFLKMKGAKDVKIYTGRIPY